MVSQLFVNLPVKDLARSRDFFAALGFKFQAQFTDEKAACLILGSNQFAMLVTEPFFATFTPKPISDAHRATEALVALAVESREEVERLVHAALTAGGTRHLEPHDHGFMYQWSFADPDGHVWEPFYMDPAYVEPAAATG